MRDLFERLRTDGEVAIDQLIEERRQEAVNLEFKRKENVSEGGIIERSAGARATTLGIQQFNGRFDCLEREGHQGPRQWCRLCQQGGAHSQYREI